MPKGLRETKKDALRRTLFETALKLFKKHGYENVSVTQIVESAGVAKGTFFNHFPTKAHLLAMWYDTAVRTAFSGWDLKTTGCWSDDLIRLTLKAVDLVHEDPALSKAKALEASKSEALQKIEQDVDDYMKSVAQELYASAVARGEISSALQPKAFAELYLALVTGTAHEWEYSGRKRRLKTVMKKRIGDLCAIIGR